MKFRINWSFVNERNVFILFTVANLIPVFLTYYVGSLDGPKHLQVSNMMIQLWKGNETYRQFYVFDPLFNGNVLGNYIIALFNLVLPAWLAEKLFITTYLISLVTGFRYLVVSIKGKSDYLTLLIFPFTYTSLFMLGYYNFSLAIGLMFYTLGYWIRQHKSMNILKSIVLTLLILFTYFAHLFIFGFLLAITGFYTVFEFFNELALKEPNTFKKFLNRTGILIASAMPSLILSVFYIREILKYPAGDGATGQFGFLKKINDLNILIGYHRNMELVYVRVIYFLVISLVVWILISRIIGYITRYRSVKYRLIDFLLKSDFWFLVTILIFGFYLFLPNQMNSAGNVSMRVAILLIYMLILWISLQDFPKKLVFIPVLIILYAGISLKSIHVKFLKPLDEIALELQSVEKLIPENSVILTANFSENWILNHFRSYIGTKRPVIDLRNQSCSKLFVVNWNHKEMPFTFVGAKDAQHFTGFHNNPRNQFVTIVDYIVIIDFLQFEKFDQNDPLPQTLKRDYELVYKAENKFVAVFKFAAQEKVEAYRKYILGNSKSMEMIKKKAQHFEVPLETALERDALWLYDQAFPIPEEN
ncbi:MAG: hypothetical protein HOO86_06850 [Bacteroidales bacterium]|nr:hypothetical protein [Bacteroidales bacterium]